MYGYTDKKITIVIILKVGEQSQPKNTEFVCDYTDYVIITF